MYATARILTLVRFAVFATCCGLLAGTANAADTGAVGNGDWSNAATWTNGVPGSTNLDNAYIGGIYPTGAATIATVTLSQNTTAGTVYLGNGAGTSGTVDLNGFNLTATNLYLGQNGGTGSLVRTGGGAISVSTGFTQASGTSFSFDPSDAAGFLNIANNSTVTTTAAGNLIHFATIAAGNSLILGTDASFSPYQTRGGTRGGGIDLSGNLNANGHTISAGTMNLGVNGGPFALVNLGPLNIGTLSVSSEYSPITTFNLTASDSVGNLWLYGVSTALPATAVLPGSLLLHSNGASPPTYASASTSSVGNVGISAVVDSGCTLTLGANLNVIDTVAVNGTLNANGHSITASRVNLGGPFVLNNRGPMNVSFVTVDSTNSPTPLSFNPTAADSIGSLWLLGVDTVFPVGYQGSLALDSNYANPPVYSTALVSGNCGNSTLAVNWGSTLTLAGDTTCRDIRINGTFNANGHSVSALFFEVGYDSVGVGPVALQNQGLITTSSWKQAGGALARLEYAGDVFDNLAITGDSILTVSDALGQMVGLTVNQLGSGYTGAFIEAGSDLALEVNGLAGGWVFRWANNPGKDHITDLQKLINGGEIAFSYLNGGSYALSSDGTYTYVNVIPAPEPSTLLLTGAGALFVVGRLRKRGSRDRSAREGNRR